MGKLIDDIITDSRLTQSKNGKIRDKKDNKNNDNKPTSEQKWWISFLVGLLFAFISSPFLYTITNHIVYCISGCNLLYYNCYDYYGGASCLGLIFHTIIFTLILRFLLW